jgi:DNA-directed RNA polymerase subunit M/transcription elongation factor TFIIS
MEDFTYAVPFPEGFLEFPDALDRVHKFDHLGSILSDQGCFARLTPEIRLITTARIEQFIYDLSLSETKETFDEENYANHCFFYTNLLEDCPGLLQMIIDRNSSPLILQKIESKFLKSNPIEFRLPSILNFLLLFESDAGFQSLPEERRINIPIKLERVCHNAICREMKAVGKPTNWHLHHFQGTYVECCVNLLIALETKKELIKSVVTDEININELPFIKAEYVRPDLHDKLTKKIEARSQVTVRKKVSSLYTCPKCKSKKCTMENVYNRSFDEGTSLKCTCVVCFTEFMVGG